MAAPLTPKQQRFVDEYLIDLNATQAAVRAGYSAKTAQQMGSENLSKPVIAAAIAARQVARVLRVETSQDYVLTNLTEVVERTMQRAPVMVKTDKGWVHDTDDDGRHVWTFDAKNALGGLALIGKHHGMFTEKHEHRFSDLPKEEAAGRIAAILNGARTRKSGNGAHSNGHR